MVVVAGSVSRVNVTPFTVFEQEAFPVTFPAVAEVKVAESCPLAFVVPVIGPAGFATAPCELVSVIVQFAPLAATKVLAVPSFTENVNVNVCD